MKVIGNLQGAAKCSGPQEAILPVDGVSVRKIAEALIKRFAIASAPSVGSTASETLPMLPPMQFPNGTLQIEGRTIGINSIQLMNGYIAVVAATTEDAEIALNATIEALNNEAGFRISVENTTCSRLSTIVVQFDADVRQHFQMLGRIAEILETALPKQRPTDHPVVLKRIGFGRYSMDMGGLTFETMEMSDFALENRVGQEFEKNWYFSSAPVSTVEHVKLLEKIEAILLKR